MDLEAIKARLADWCAANPFVLQAYIFGSRSRNDFTAESDLDIALVISPMPADSNSLATWINQSKAWKAELETLLPFKIDLHQLDDRATPTIKSGIESSSVLVFSRAV